MPLGRALVATFAPFLNDYRARAHDNHRARTMPRDLDTVEKMKGLDDDDRRRVLTLNDPDDRVAFEEMP